MIYSKSKNFLFVHIPKTAGTSIRSVLEPYGGKPGLTNFIGRRLEDFPGFCNKSGLVNLRTYDSHTTYERISQLIDSDRLDNIFKFAFVRHPFDRLYSFYLHILAHPEHPWFRKISNYGSFSMMVSNLEEVGEPTQLSYVIDSDGRLKMDYIGYFENLHTDFKRICKQIDVPFNLPKKNVRYNRKSWKEIYSDLDVENAYNYYRVDFENFNYDI